MSDEGEEPPPVLRWKKVVAGIVITFLVLYPMYFLLQFGLAQGKRMVRSWLIGTLTCWALSFAIYEPVQIVFLNVLIPALIRGKVKVRRLIRPLRTCRVMRVTWNIDRDTTLSRLAASH